MAFYSPDIYAHQPPPRSNSWRDNNRIARTGDNHAGFYNYGLVRSIPANEPSNLSGHERLLHYLPEPLQTDKDYFVQFYFKPSLYPIYSSFDQLYHSPNISLGFFEGTLEAYKQAAQNAIWGMPEVRIGALNNRYESDRLQFENWQVVEGCYTANSEEQLIVIGNHLPHTDSEFTLLDSTELVSKLSYVIIDDIFIGGAPSFNITDTTICKGDNYSISVPQDSFLQVNLFRSGQVMDNWMITEAGDYQIQGTYGMCPIQYNFTIKEQQCRDCNIYIPNIFSPNGDGINDALTIASDCNLRILDIQVFDRWGNQLFKQDKNIDNNQLWDGLTSDDQKIAGGVFVYHLRYQVDQVSGFSKVEWIAGDVTIVR